MVKLNGHQSQQQFWKKDAVADYETNNSTKLTSWTLSHPKNV